MRILLRRNCYPLEFCNYLTTLIKIILKLSYANYKASYFDDISSFLVRHR
jgi:hypothetical protein